MKHLAIAVMLVFTSMTPAFACGDSSVACKGSVIEHQGHTFCVPDKSGAKSTIAGITLEDIGSGRYKVTADGKSEFFQAYAKYRCLNSPAYLRKEGSTS